MALFGNTLNFRSKMSRVGKCNTKSQRQSATCHHANQAPSDVVDDD